MTDAQAAVQLAIMQYTQDSDNINQELLSHVAAQTHILTAVVVVLIVLVWVCGFRRLRS